MEFRDTSQSVFTAFLVVYVLCSLSRDAASVVVNARPESSQIFACVVFFQSVIRLRMSEEDKSSNISLPNSILTFNPTSYDEVNFGNC